MQKRQGNNLLYSFWPFDVVHALSLILSKIKETIIEIEYEYFASLGKINFSLKLIVLISSCSIKRVVNRTNN